MGAEVELSAEYWELKKKRMVEMHKSPDRCICCSLDLTVSFNLFPNGRETLNKAEVYLLPEELTTFTGALIQHPNLFPISYSQHLSKKDGIYCIRLESLEPFEDFAERLSEALSVLG